MVHKHNNWYTNATTEKMCVISPELPMFIAITLRITASRSLFFDICRSVWLLVLKSLLSYIRSLSRVKLRREPLDSFIASIVAAIMKTSIKALFWVFHQNKQGLHLIGAAFRATSRFSNKPFHDTVQYTIYLSVNSFFQINVSIKS